MDGEKRALPQRGSWGSIWENIIDREIWRTVEERTAPAVLWHYTTAAGLYGIVTHRYLRATSSRFLNDQSEIEYGHSLLETVVRDMLPTIKPGDLRDAVSTLGQMARTWGNFVHTWVTSFSVEEDDLAQWRSYGGAVDRYCIGFDFAGLTLLKSAHTPKSVYQSGMHRVEYDAETQYEILRRSITSAAEVDRFEEEFPLFATELTRVFPFFKNPAFESECEWRYLLVAPPPPGVDCFESGGSLKPFVKLEPQRDSRLPILKVIALSSKDTSRAVDAAKYLFEAHRMGDVDVKPSEIPYVG